MKKKCPKCSTVKDVSLFSNNSTRADGLQSHCKVCRSERRKADYLKNKQHELELSKVWAKDNPEAVKAKASKHRQSDHGSAYYNTRNARSRAKKLSATPDWLTDNQHDDIKSMYALAKKFSGICGIPYHVDHITPLKGKNVCGLHVPWNLQLLAAPLNLSKGNRVPNDEWLYQAPTKTRV